MEHFTVSYIFPTYSTSHTYSVVQRVFFCCCCCCFAERAVAEQIHFSAWSTPAVHQGKSIQIPLQCLSFVCFSQTRVWVNLQFVLFLRHKLIHPWYKYNENICHDHLSLTLSLWLSHTHCCALPAAVML